MRGIPSAVVFICWIFLVSSEKHGSADTEPIISTGTMDLRRIRRPSSDLSVSGSVAREKRILSGYDDDSLEDLDPKSELLRSDYLSSSNGIFDDEKKFNPNPKKSFNTTKKGGGYGYPYRMAPTLPPYVEHREDEYEHKSVITSTSRMHSAPKIPSMPRIPDMPTISSHESPKGTDTLKKRQGFDFSGTSGSRDLMPVGLGFSSYREPSYRNTYDLEFSPRRMYEESRRSYSRPSFSFPTLKPSPAVSPRDPYLSPSDGPIDGFYPKVKNNGVSVSHSTYGKKDKYYKTISESDSSPPRAYDGEEDFSYPTSDEVEYGFGQRGYGKSQDEPSSYSGSYPDPSSKGSGEEGSYESLYNSPITGMTRKRLLDYAGASDLYGGEPDYLKSAGYRKTKFDSLEDDYYPYPRVRSQSFTDYHFDESRKVPSRTKRETAPKCAGREDLTLCLTDQDYPSEKIKKIVSKSQKLVTFLRFLELRTVQKKGITPQSLDDLEKIKGMCPSRKGAVYPKRAKDMEGNWRIVVNVDGARQSLNIEVCRRPEVPCEYVPTVIPTKCDQKYAKVTMVTFREEDDALELHDFPVPTSCSCSVERPTRSH